MEEIKIAAKDCAKDNGVTGGHVTNQVMEEKPESRSCYGDWSVSRDKTELNSLIEVEFNAGSIIFAIGLLGTLVWSFIGNAGSYSTSAPLYHALTNEAIASANGFTAISPVAALIAISICGSVVGAVLGLVVNAIFGRKERVENPVSSS